MKRKEKWLPVVGMEKFYDVSNFGRVRSKHTVGCRKHCGEVILSLKPNQKGYLRINLRGNGKNFTTVVHRLVLTAFVGPQPSPIHESNHKNGKKPDNRVWNLEWVTPVENNAHAVKSGLWKPALGEDHGMARLTKIDVKIIRRLLGIAKARDLATVFGVSSTAIRLVWRKVNWKHVK